MTTRPDSIHRRDLLRGGLVLAGGAILTPAWIFDVLEAQQKATPADPVAAIRVQTAAAPVDSRKLTDALTMLSGPGGNVVVLNGRDGKFVVDTFVQGAWDKLKQSLDALGAAPVKAAIDTHWHFDHADNNAGFRKAGAAVIAHENTKKRMSQKIEVKALGLMFPPSPPEALPTEIFKDTRTIAANGEQIRLGYIPPAHTDTDIYIWFEKGNVLHLGDLFFNGIYPFIDAATGGSINGMIRAAETCLKLGDGTTRIVPGHGPLGDRAALTAYRDMMVTVRDRVQKLKTSGRGLEETVAAKPTADLDATWGKGFLQPDVFVRIVYATL
jgi:glyoxylase-like metal-dependent hydrolase (beta-lactamase superfamily II)